MSLPLRFRGWPYLALVLTLVIGFALSSAAFAAGPEATGSPLQLSSDPYTNSTSQHQTGLSRIATPTARPSSRQHRLPFLGRWRLQYWLGDLTDSGATWQSRFLPGTTPYSTPTGSYDPLSDPSVAYDAAHSLWMISSLAVSNTGLGSPNGVAVLVSISSDGGLTWNAPIAVATTSGSGFFDKDGSCVMAPPPAPSTATAILNGT